MRTPTPGDASTGASTDDQRNGTPVSWLARLSGLLGLDGLGPEGATVNAARSLTQDHQAVSDLEVLLIRFAHPARSTPSAASGVEGRTVVVRWEPTDVTGEVRVLFEVQFDGHSGRLAVVGDFNGWDPTATPLVRHGRLLQAIVTIRAGLRYEYRYFAAEDWRWLSDNDEYGYEPQRRAADNNVLDLTGAQGQ